MKLSDWSMCLASAHARSVSPDRARAASLVETADARIAVSPSINTKNCDFVFEDYYTSLLEVLQALLFSRGYNVSNHVCIGFYIRDVLGRDDLFAMFEDLRYKRNSLTYYGNRLEYEVALDAVEKCKGLMRELGEITE